MKQSNKTDPKSNKDGEISGRKFTTKKDNQDNSPESIGKDKKKGRRTLPEIETFLSGQIESRKICSNYTVWMPDRGDPQILKFDAVSRTMSMAADEVLAASLVNVTPDGYDVTFSQAIGVAKRWKWVTDRPLKSWPKAVAFNSDNSACFSRLNFDPAPSYQMTDFPIISEMLSRMTNANAFSTVLGSFPFPESSRKQVIWLHGQTNSGKSFLLNNLVSKVCGGQLGTATFSGEALSGAHWKEPLLGKSLLVINEASAKFIRSDSFKSLTGDDLHMINPKGLKMFQGRIGCRIFFSSNEAPEIPNDEALKSRIIECEMTEVPKESRVNADELEKMIEKELPFYIAYCMDLYLKSGGKDIESDQTGINQAIADYESDLQFTFDRCFQVEEGAILTSNEVQLYLETFLDYRKGITLPRMRAFIAKTYGIKAKQMKIGGKNINRYVGIKVRPDWGLPPTPGRRVEI